MKPGPKSSPPEPAPLLAFGAHPDDIEFGCGGIMARETHAGRPVHFVVCSRGEAGTHGTPAQRTTEARRAAKLLGATIEFADLGGDAHVEEKSVHVVTLAKIIRRMRPGFVLVPSTVENQHPDHYKLGRMVRDAARLARYGGVKELRHGKPHSIGQLFYYAVTPEAEPRDVTPVFIDVSAVHDHWLKAMEAHRSQLKTRPYHLLQMARASVLGQRLGLQFAMVLFPNDPLVFDSLASLGRSGRRY
jgi:LmbE family N-acetylglucosaminyl deacetylase